MALVAEVRESPELTAAFDAGAADLLDRLRSMDDEDAARFLAHVEEFMLEYGARGPNEWDPYSEVWETRPELVLALVDRMRVTDEDQSPVARNESVAADGPRPRRRSSPRWVTTRRRKAWCWPRRRRRCASWPGGSAPRPTA